MISRILAFLSHTFLFPKEEILFDDLFADRNPHYREGMGEHWALDGTFVALDYTEVLKKELWAYKYFSKREKRNLFSSPLSECFRLLCLEHIGQDTIVCPVPLHFWSHLGRGYNHSELLARDLSQNENLRFGNLLKKGRRTKHQAMLGKSERMMNVRWSFSFRKKHLEEVQGRDVLIVDDVISTGSTVNECAHVLKKNGAKRVFGIFLATGG